VLDDKRRGRVAAPAVIEASSRVQGPSLAAVALEGKTHTVTPVAIEVHAGVIAGEITDMQVVQRVERSPGAPSSWRGSWERSGSGVARRRTASAWWSPQRSDVGRVNVGAGRVSGWSVDVRNHAAQTTVSKGRTRGLNSPTGVSRWGHHLNLAHLPRLGFHPLPLA